ncbi:MAG: FkbM family methyltransferase [Rhizobiales bacterium PAR1]|nr:MAG: FkbM family methyltransferase [Rhizobiales bacterium PAR1]
MNDASPPFGAFAATGLVSRLISWTRAMPRSWFGKRIGFLLRRIAISQLKGAPVDQESLGARFRLHPYNNVCEKRILFSPRDFDEAERDLLVSRITKRFVFLDIGANIGGYALAVAAKAGPDARIIAFEPQPEIFERLIQNIRLNPFGNVKALALAVADRDGELTLFLDPRNKGEASVKIVSADEARQVRVPARALLSIVREEGFDHIDAMKLDVEGAEDIILKRFFADAPENLWPKLIIVERGEERWSGDLIGHLASLGYRSTGQTRNNHILER